ncbi:unnamed protein product [Hyaloperonospora brassicae]|uniref:Nep1-like protein n=1 Tax=Hyaloperonospora brassicae TaxID=162125 RepID=A0AAV0TDY1_HYABA|nr:unnamed protein product [Hyaloperonospora brassicae]
MQTRTVVSTTLIAVTAAAAAAGGIHAKDGTNGTLTFESPVLTAYVSTVYSTPTRKSSLELWTPKWIKHHLVQPFPEPEPTSVSDCASVMFKPQLHVVRGCHPYPAVNEVGETGSGLKPTGRPDGQCKGSGYGSQIYGRSVRYRGKWAIMYAWYFPKDNADHKRHDWEHVIVWIDNPAAGNPEVLAVTPSCGKSAYLRKVPPGPEYMSGESVKLSYGADIKDDYRLKFTTETGEHQSLIMWEQLPEDARRAFNGILWSNVMMPLNDAWFMSELKRAWPFGKWKKGLVNATSGTAS